jgi:hemerythrin superfamily protein
MIKEMLGIAEGILQDLHDDHKEVASLIDRIMESTDRSQRDGLFREMKAMLLSHSQAEQEVLYRRLEGSQHEGSRNFAHEGASEHQLVEQQLQKMSSDDDKMSEHWTADLIVLRELVDHHVDEEESTGFSCARDEFDKNELEGMGTRFRRRKEELVTETV